MDGVPAALAKPMARLFRKLAEQHDRLAPDIRAIADALDPGGKRKTEVVDDEDDEPVKRNGPAEVASMVADLKL
jgi:hypothetical protein